MKWQVDLGKGWMFLLTMSSQKGLLSYSQRQDKKKKKKIQISQRHQERLYPFCSLRKEA